MFGRIAMGGNGMDRAFFAYIIGADIPMSEQAPYGLAAIINAEQPMISGREVTREVRSAAIAEWKVRYPDPNHKFPKHWAQSAHCVAHNLEVKRPFWQSS